MASSCPPWKVLPPSDNVPARVAPRDTPGTPMSFPWSAAAVAQWPRRAGTAPLRHHPKAQAPARRKLNFFDQHPLPLLEQRDIVKLQTPTNLQRLLAPTDDLPDTRPFPSRRSRPTSLALPNWLSWGVAREVVGNPLRRVKCGCIPLLPSRPFTLASARPVPALPLPSAFHRGSRRLLTTSRLDHFISPCTHDRWCTRPGSRTIPPPSAIAPSTSPRAKPTPP